MTRYEPKLDSDLKPAILHIKENWNKDFIILTDLESRYHLSFLLGNRQVYPMNLDLESLKNERSNIDSDILKILASSSEEDIKKFLEDNSIKLVVIRKSFSAENTQIVTRISALTRNEFCTLEDYLNAYIENTKLWKNYDFLEIDYEDENCIVYLKK